jgi:heme exporter protein A
MIPALELTRIGKSYGRHRALVDVSLRFEAGRVAVVLGPNGAGKSTLLGILAMLAQPSTGTLQWGSDRLDRGHALRSRIGYVGHEPGAYGDLTAAENLELFARLHGVDAPARRAAEGIARVGLGGARPDVPVRAFSRGMQQRLALARALLHAPDLLLFDEPASALDPAGAAWLSRELDTERAAGRLVILVTHDLEAAAAVADHVVILRRGKVVHDDPAAGRPTPAALRALYEERTRG